MAAEGAADANSAARGFALIATNLQALMAGDMDTARPLAVEMIELAHRLGDRDLLAWGLMCEGEVSIAVGDVRHGIQLLDEAMLCVATGELSPIPAGIVYCAAIDACLAAFDLRRAGEWTDALATWCTSQSGLVPFRGQCLVHRSQLLQARGAWTTRRPRLSGRAVSSRHHPARRWGWPATRRASCTACGVISQRPIVPTGRLRPTVTTPLPDSLC